jgi:hypothetical protein
MGYRLAAKLSLPLHFSHLLIAIAFDTSLVRLISKYLYHLEPMAWGMRLVGSLLVGYDSYSEEQIVVSRELCCLAIWLFLQVVGGFLVPAWLLYRDELRLRQRFLEILQQRTVASAVYEQGLLRFSHTEVYLPALCILPVAVFFLGPRVLFEYG